MTPQQIEQQLHDTTQSKRRTNFADELDKAVILLRTLSDQVEHLRHILHEDDAATRRRKAKNRETAVDPKPPVKPVRVAEPSKPKKPKYSGL
ncbi:hypothetical protein Q4494_04305 [Celeribacter halophilus]|uniref:Transposase C of IS166 homeodomain-containing protein n=1 Tax=Celeribacter halophilus TaxID=576117 RepID=A0AAW7XQJ0_9RHOB|nr:hypothetical protein [Celeribacter halophilus]MDO6456290.1 hypothetical protein [Celeribacter halophilus]